MPDYEFLVTEDPPAELHAELATGLNEHARSFTERPGFQPLAVAARNARGELAGGVLGRVNWNWLHINLLWVAAPLRGQGLGSRLLRRIEQAASSRGCGRAHVDTFSYQARPFYERHGYRTFAELDDYPPGQSRVFLRKDL